MSELMQLLCPVIRGNDKGLMKEKPSNNIEDLPRIRPRHPTPTRHHCKALADSLPIGQHKWSARRMRINTHNKTRVCCLLSHSFLPIVLLQFFIPDNPWLIAVLYRPSIPYSITLSPLSCSTLCNLQCPVKPKVYDRSIRPPKIK